MAVSNSYSSKKWDDGATAEHVAATELDRHQRDQDAAMGFLNGIDCTRRESSSPKTAVACIKTNSTIANGDIAVEGFDPAFAVPENEKTENLSIDRLERQHRYQFQLPRHYQYQPKRASNSLRWFPFEAIGLAQFNSTSSSTRTPHHRDAHTNSPRRDARGSLRGTLRNLPVARSKVSTKSARRAGGAS